MENKSLDVLYDLLQTPSPSGMEMSIQKKWLEYIRPYVDEFITDNSGNVIGILNPEAKFKVLLAAHCDEIGFVITKIESDGFLRFSKVGGISPKIAIGMKVTVIGANQTITGVVGASAEHHGGAKDKIEFEDLYIDCGAKSKDEIEQFVQIGDLAVYKRDPEMLMDRYISGRGLDNRTGLFIVGEVLKTLSKRKLNVGLYVASTVNEETNYGGAYFAAASIKPTLAIACDVTFATDYPGVNKTKHGDIRLEHGPVLAKGSPINYKINKLLEASAKQLNINVQYEITPRNTFTDADKIRYTGSGVPVALVSLPLRYMHSPVETVSIKDIEDEIKLLIHTIESLTGEESLNPLEV